MILQSMPLTMALLCLLLLLPARVENPGAVNRLEDDAFAALANPREEYGKWKEAKLKGKGDFIPHFSLTASTRSIGNKNVVMSVAAVGPSSKGFKLELEPIRWERGEANAPIQKSAGKATDFRLPGLSKDETAGILNPISEGRLMLTADEKPDAYRIKISFRRPGSPHKSIDDDDFFTAIVPVSDETQTYTFGAVFASDRQALKGKSPKGMLSQDYYSIECTPNCNFYTIYGGPNGCKVDICCQDSNPIMDPIACRIICWTECWRPN